MNKKDLAELVAKKTMSKREALQIVDDVFDNIVIALKNREKVHISGFGTLTIKERAAKIGRNPRTNEEVKIPPRNVIKYIPAAHLKII